MGSGPNRMGTRGRVRSGSPRRAFRNGGTMRRVAIVAGARTPFVRAGKAFASLGPLALARHAVRGLIDRHGVDPASLDAMAFGAVVPEPGKPNLAREIVLEEGLPPRIEAQT